MVGLEMENNFIVPDGFWRCDWLPEPWDRLSPGKASTWQLQGAISDAERCPKSLGPNLPINHLQALRTAQSQGSSRDIRLKIVSKAVSSPASSSATMKLVFYTYICRKGVRTGSADIHSLSHGYTRTHIRLHSGVDWLIRDTRRCTWFHFPIVPLFSHPLWEAWTLRA